MRVTSHSTAYLVAALLSLSCRAAAAAGSSAGGDPTKCLQSRSDELAMLASCGDEGSIQYCLSNLLAGSTLETSMALEQCFVNAGCTAAEARIEAEWSIKRCDFVAADGGNLGELRRRASDSSTTTTEDSTTTTSSKTSTTSTTSTDATTTSETTTTSDSTSTTSTTSTTAATTATSTSTSTTGTSATTATSTDSTYSSTSTSTTGSCYTTTTVSTTTCPVQSTGTASGSTLSCYSTTTAYATCAAGMLCSTDTHGNNICLKLKNNLNTGGIIVCIVFGGAALISASAICFCCCSERREHSRMAKAAEAAAIAKQAALDKKRPLAGARSVSANSDTQPLMGHQPQQQRPDVPVIHSPDMGDISGPNPFTDQQQHHLR